MYYADSDFLSILLAIITIAAGAYSSLSKAKKKKGSVGKNIEDKRAQQEYVAYEHDDEEEEEDSPFFSLKSIIEEVEQEMAQAEELEEMGEVEFVDELPQEGEKHFAAQQAMIEQQAMLAEQRVMALQQMQVESTKLNEEAVPTTVTAELEPQAEELQTEELQSGLKIRLKSSPKDAILFSEILKPKYKEF